MGATVGWEGGGNGVLVAKGLWVTGKEVTRKTVAVTAIR